MPGGGLRTNLSMKKTMEMVEDIYERAKSQEITIADDPNEAHRVMSCKAVLCVMQAIKATADIVIDESVNPADDTMTMEQMEEYFLSYIPFHRLTPLTNTVDSRVKSVICSYTRLKIPTMSIAARRSGGSDWERICGIILERMDYHELLEEDDTVESYMTKILQSIKNKKSIALNNYSSSDTAPVPQQTEERTQEEVPERKYEPSYISDGSRVDRAVQAAFSTVGTDDSSKFTGDLSKAPSFDIWEKRYTALMARNFPALKEDQKVEHLQDALSGDAQRFFLKEIVPRSARPHESLDELRGGMSRYAASPTNISSLSLALREIEKRFCTRESKGVLYKELQRLTLSKIRKDLRTDDNAEAIRGLKREIECKSANGPKEYRSDICQTDIMVKAMRGESWALMPLLKCEESEGHTTIQQYADTLISHLHLKNSLQPVGRRTDQLTFYANDDYGDANDDGAEDGTVYFGDARHKPRINLNRNGMRRSFSHGNLSGRAPAQPISSPRFNSKVPQGNELRAMLESAAIQPPNDQGQAQWGSICWRCKKNGHRWRQCPQPASSILEAAKTYLAESPNQAAALVPLLAAQCDDSYHSEMSGVHHAETDDEDNESVIMDQNDAIQDLYLAFHNQQDF